MAEFADIDAMSTEEGMAEWGVENAESISRLMGILEEVVDVVRSMKVASIVSHKKDKDDLVICKAVDEIKRLVHD